MIIETNNFEISGVRLFSIKSYEDNRGVFSEVYLKTLDHPEFKIEYVQENESISNFGVFRGMHLQKGDNSQSKLIRVVKGKIIDYCIDLRKKSKTFGKIFKYTLKEKSVLLVPKGFAHGYTGISKENIIVYFLSEYRYSKFEKGISLFDKAIKINLNKNKLIISEKDKRNYTISEFEKKIGSL